MKEVLPILPEGNSCGQKNQAKQENTICKHCNKDVVAVPVTYGYSTPKMEEEAKRSVVVYWGYISTMEMGMPKMSKSDTN